jgi:hypothetical protein
LVYRCQRIYSQARASPVNEPALSSDATRGFRPWPAPIRCTSALVKGNAKPQACLVAEQGSDSTNSAFRYDDHACMAAWYAIMVLSGCNSAFRSRIDEEKWETESCLQYVVCSQRHSMAWGRNVTFLFHFRGMVVLHKPPIFILEWVGGLW